jgi:O-antigen/teichoic acid export membrane protein
MLSAQPPQPSSSDSPGPGSLRAADGPADPELQLGATSGAGVVSGGLWSILGRILPQLQLVVLSVVAARFLGPDGMGRQSLIAFVGLTTVMVATAGFPSSVRRFVGELLGARKGGVALGLYGWTWRVETTAAIVAGAALIGAGLLGSEPTLAWVLVGAASALAVLQSIPQALLSGAQRWREATVVGVVTGVFSVPVTIAVLAAGGGISGFFAVEVVVMAINLAWTGRLARGLASRMGPEQPIPPELRQRFLSFAGITTLNVLIQYVIWTRSELLVLDRVSVDAQIALYSIAFATVSGLARIPEATARVMMPAVATLIGAREMHRVRAGFWRAMRLLLFMTPPVVAGAAVTGPALISLAYGSEFAAAGDVLLVLLAPLLVLPLITTSEALLFALARLRFLLTLGILATIVDVSLAIVLIPRFDALGAAIANAAAQLSAGIPCLVLAARLNGPVELEWQAIARGLGLAAAVALVAALTLAGLGDEAPGVVAAVLAGALLFVVLAPVIRPMATADAAWLAGALSGGGAVRRRLGRAIIRLAPAPEAAP